jgi:hypothetical protein
MHYASFITKAMFTARVAEHFNPFVSVIDTVHSESIQTPLHFPHFVMLQPYPKTFFFLN